MSIRVLITAALLPLSLTGCVSIMVGDVTQGRTLPSKWDNQCFVLLQDVDLREARYLWPGGMERILATKDARLHLYRKNDDGSYGYYGHLKPVDQIPAGTQLRVAKIYDWMQVGGKSAYWYMKVNVQVMQGTYAGLEIEIPTVVNQPRIKREPDSNWINPYWIDYPERAVKNRQDLNPDSIVFDPTILRPCD